MRVLFLIHLSKLCNDPALDFLGQLLCNGCEWRLLLNPLTSLDDARGSQLLNRSRSQAFCWRTLANT